MGMEELKKYAFLFVEMRGRGGESGESVSRMCIEEYLTWVMTFEFYSPLAIG